MSEVLRSPWLLQTVLDDLSNDPTEQSGLNHLHRTPKLVQIIQFMSSGSNTTHMLAHLSDKFHYIVSLFSDKSLGNFVKSHPGWSISEIQGAIIKILEYRIVKVPCSGDAEVGDSIVLVVEEFEHVGSDGSAPFGDPRYVHCNPAVRASLQRPAPSSPSKKDQHQSSSDSYSFTQSLDPSDLLFLESTCTQTYQRQSRAFPQVITDLDWKIPAEQAKILAGIKLDEVVEFEYGKSDVELSESEAGSPQKLKRKREDGVIFPETQTLSEINSQRRPQSNSQRQSQSNSQGPSQSSLPRYSSQGQLRNTQANTQAYYQPFTQAQTQVQTQSQTTISNVTNGSTTQTPPLSEPVVFPETQMAMQSSPVKREMMQSSPVRKVASPSRSAVIVESPLVRDVIKTTIQTSTSSNVPSSPINSPVKKHSSSALGSPTKPSATQEPVPEYPDYSSW